MRTVPPTGAAHGRADNRRGDAGRPPPGFTCLGCQAGQGFDDRTFLKSLNRMVGWPLAAG
jgi:hypothetical protein